MAFELETLREHNSSLLDLLTQHLPDMLWVKDIDGIYLYANQAICDGLLMAKDTQEPIGKGDVFFALREREAHKDNPEWHTFGELCFNSDFDVIENNRAMKFEEYGNVKGELLYLEVYKAPFYDKDGNIIGTVGAGRDITELKKIQKNLEDSLQTLQEQREQLKFQANHDSLTTLPNRVLFMDRLEQSINMARRLKESMAVLFIDLDNFKEINDSLGHHIGDKILIEVSKRMQSQMRASDTLARLGGDEFAIILNNLNNSSELSNIISNGMESFKEPFFIENNVLHVSMSIGIAMCPHDGEDANTLLKNADVAMYKAKKEGRNRYSFYNEEMTQKAKERVYLETELRKAFVNDELCVYYQAQVDASKNEIIGMEALVRWQHPKMGFVFPDKFIPLAELTGMIIELDRIVMSKAIGQFAEWHRDGYSAGKLSMNLSIKQIEEKDFIEFIKNLVNEKECLFENLEFEVTETQVMNDPVRSIEALKEISTLGMSIAIDDFGTGYSSLAYLKKLPLDKLKIDKSFVDNLPDDKEDSAITKTIISLCQSLNLDVIAEGVETQEQQEFLAKNGCSKVQGYLYSKPLNAKDMKKFIIEHEKDRRVE
ncbi:MAG: EAL domain-containing protein [Campylobacterota bacterium]|nr:EAL domain-containing protein [Campylobacterota bacterium]